MVTGIGSYNHMSYMQKNLLRCYPLYGSNLFYQEQMR
jgi:hypothetical protein